MIGFKLLKEEKGFVRMFDHCESVIIVVCYLKEVSLMASFELNMVTEPLSFMKSFSTCCIVEFLI